MKTIRNNNFDPYFNLALEEYLLKSTEIEDDIFFLWRNKKSVVIGRNQNPYNEVDINYAKENDIDIVRRSSGGGTVYHDKGNINFTYITSKVINRLHNFEFFLHPIITILNSLGIQAKFSPKTHIYVGKHKISGNAQALHKNRMIHHGTLLFDVDIIHMNNVLIRKSMIDTHAITSEPADILNIIDILDVDLIIEEFMEYIIEQMGIVASDEILLSKKQENEINDLAISKYRSWNWTFGQTPKFTIMKNEYKFEVLKGIIVKSSHYDDLLVGKHFDKEIISKSLKGYIDKDKILDLLFI